MISRFLNASWTFFERLITRSFGFIGNLLGYLFNQLFTLLKLLFQPIFIVVGILFYLLYKIGALAVLLLRVFVGVGQLFVAFLKGIFATLAGFSFTPSTRSDGQWTSVFHNVVSGLDRYQFDTLAYVLLFCIWFGTGWAAIRILSSIRFGGD